MVIEKIAYFIINTTIDTNMLQKSVHKYMFYYLFSTNLLGLF